MRESLVQFICKGSSRTFDPSTFSCCLLSIGNCIIAFKASEVVETNHVIETGSIADPLFPPAVVVFLHPVPGIEGISPKLAVSVEVVWRNSADFLWVVGSVKLEHLWRSPDISAVQSYIDRHISNDSDFLILCVGSKGIPLSEEQVLHEGIEGDVI